MFVRISPSATSISLGCLRYLTVVPQSPYMILDMHCLQGNMHAIIFKRSNMRTPGRLGTVPQRNQMYPAFACCYHGSKPESQSSGDLGQSGQNRDPFFFFFFFFFFLLQSIESTHFSIFKGTFSDARHNMYLIKCITNRNFCIWNRHGGYDLA